MSSGKSKSQSFPTGKRRVVGGKELAPKSARKAGRKYLSECSDMDIKKAGV